MQNSSTNRVEIDFVYKWIHITQNTEILRLLSMESDQTSAICAVLGFETLECAAFLDIAGVDQEESLLLQLNTRRCNNSDLTVLQQRPIHKKKFTVKVHNTSKLYITHVTACNEQKLGEMGWERRDKTACSVFHNKKKCP